MITRMKISGFKNIVELDVRFGPFTCIAGANGVGKSNLFDAITFLSALAEKTFIEAAMYVRGEGGRTADVRHLFHRNGDRYIDTMSFEVEMIIPSEGTDDYGQTAMASITSLRYKLVLAYRKENSEHSQGRIELFHETLEPMKIGEANRNFLFEHKAGTWRKSAVKGRRSGGAFISTMPKDTASSADKMIQMHQDKGGGKKENWSRGSGRSFRAATLPRTVLSSATNAVESPTALLVRREMQAWRLLQLEPSALRKPDEITAPRRLGADGAHLPATLHRLAGEIEKNADENTASQVYAELANQLSELINDVQKVQVDRDEKRDLLTLEVVDRDGTAHPARSLSDGTLRFLALSILGMDREEKGLLCLEEPENGIHPERIPAMLRLLQNIATDTDKELGADNPLNQVIINTHSPAVVAQIPDHSLLVAESREYVDREGRRGKGLSLSCLDKTWRSKSEEKPRIISKGKLLSYLNPIESREEEAAQKNEPSSAGRRVIDRMQLMLPGLVQK
ncbi:AAA family ATPase [Candidatus Electronema sp. JM]|uniref:AAA family ATPase n=1 Tax=Candidatus Electronema sp. JM TaxID=3401571 RepID=UPI003AA90825